MKVVTFEPATNKHCQRRPPVRGQYDLITAQHQATGRHEPIREQHNSNQGHCHTERGRQHTAKDHQTLNEENHLT